MSNVTKARTRPSRTPVGQSGRLKVKDKDPNYQYRFVNIRDDRVDMFQEAGWEVVEKTKAGNPTDTATTSKPLGSADQRSVGLGDQAVLMRIPLEYYKEDQAAKQKIVDASEQSIKDKVRNTHGGKFERDTDL